MAAKPSPKPRMQRATNSSLTSDRCGDVPSTRNLLETPSVAQSLDGYLRLEGSLRFPAVNLDWRCVLRQAARTSLSPRAGRGKSERTRRDRIAGRDLAAVKAAGEPALALFRRAVGEGVGHDIALHLLLQPVVADRGRGLQGLVDVAGIEEMVLLLGAVRPDAGETIGLQLDAHLELVRLDLAGGGLLRLPDLRQDAKLVLHVMADLVGDHIGFGEFAGVAVRAGAELVLHVVEKRGVEIDALVERAVERPLGRFGESARRRLGAGEQPQLRRMVGPAAGGEHLGPAVFGVAEDLRHEPAGRVGRRAGRDVRGLLGLLRRRAAAGENLRAVEQHARVDPEIPADQPDDDDRADTKAAGAARHAAARRALFAIVLDIAAGTQIIRAHRHSPSQTYRADVADPRFFERPAPPHHTRLTKCFPAFIA